MSRSPHEPHAFTAADDPWIGRVLSRRYRIVARMGTGGMGVVYRAWDKHDERYVVIKAPKRELAGDPLFHERFARELAALKALSHPSVVPIVDVGNEDGTPFAVMPYMAGGSLKQRRPMRQAAPVDPSHLWRWLPAIAAALDFVHASNYVHRDVKPDNILFDGPGAPLLSDFGIATLISAAEESAAMQGLTAAGFAVGTPDYMAPELIHGTKADPRVDQYALAVVTYELLAARKPFAGPTPAAVLVAHATTAAPPLCEVRPRTPAAVSAAVARGMARKPDERFASCSAFAAAVLAGVPQPAKPEKLQLMCPQCSRLLNVKPDWAGKKGSCPECGTAIEIGADLRSLWIPTDKITSITFSPPGTSAPPRPDPPAG